MGAATTPHAGPAPAAAVTATTPAGAQLALEPSSRLTLPRLSILPQGEEHLVGDPETGVFIAVPEVGVLAVRALASGSTLGEATAAVSERVGQPVDVPAFAAVLAETGLLTAVDGQPLGPERPVRKRSRLDAIPARLIRPLFSAPAWALYGLLLAASLALIVAVPRYRPAFEDFFYYPNPAVCILTVIALNTLLTCGHELAHYLAGRAAGVGGRFAVSLRWYIPVFETELTELWAVPRRRRYGPMLAGMAFDGTVLAAALATRVAWSTGLASPPPLLVRLAALVALTRLFSLTFQCLVFLRSDLYAVMVTALGTFNLQRISRLLVRRWTVGLTPDEAAELADAHPRDRRNARWFGVVILLGIGLATWFLVRIFVPSTFVLGGWMIASMSGAPVDSGAFWQGALVGFLVLFTGFAPLLVMAWQRIRQARTSAPREVPA
jgi:putative peptide zinc metalloprotease protein